MTSPRGLCSSLLALAQTCCTALPTCRFTLWEQGPGQAGVEREGVRLILVRQFTNLEHQNYHPGGALPFPQTSPKHPGFQGRKTCFASWFLSLFGGSKGETQKGLVGTMRQRGRSGDQNPPLQVPSQLQRDPCYQLWVAAVLRPCHWLMWGMDNKGRTMALNSTVAEVGGCREQTLRIGRGLDGGGRAGDLGLLFHSPCHFSHPVRVKAGLLNSLALHSPQVSRDSGLCGHQART